ncbi:multidrug DMT transporter permease [Leptospira perolatii]|uniref:Multidrug DMT transporter permease n=1 Tax=Leptospira perolatii TaxID=2023191 RepID=A0A2M9ZIF3_9LEPT|nr:DMT family transporter [Leptospira perolatii]PJZ69082.1 multidrug DMT transporter permease [Leptospira perolatii]PJZ71791.1 multidrug DMT transporter permease [Leptospira perolatii]
MNRFRSEFSLILCTLIWGGTFTATKLSLTSVSPSFFLGMRFGIAFLVFLPILFFVSRRSASREQRLLGALSELTPNQLWTAFLLGFWMFAGFACQTIGLRFTTAIKSGFLTGTLVVITPILQTVLYRRAPSAGNLLGVIVVMAGLFFLSSEPDGGGDELLFSFKTGDLITLAGAFFFACYVIQMDSASRELPDSILLISQTFVTSIASFGLAICLSVIGWETFYWEWDPAMIPVLLYNGVLASVGTTYLQTRYQREVSPTRAAIIFSLEPVFSAFIAFFILDDRLTTAGVIGCFLVLSGVLIAEFLGKVKEEKKER